LRSDEWSCSALWFAPGHPWPCAHVRRHPPGAPPAPSRSPRPFGGGLPGRTWHLGDRVDRTDLDAGEAAGAEMVDDQGAAGSTAQGPLGTGGQALAARRAAGVDDDGHGWYPLGVTIRPATIRVADDPTMTQLVMPTMAGSSSPKAVMVTDWLGRPA